MGSVVLLFLFAAFALFLLGCKEGIILLKKRDRVCKTTGNIVDISTLAAETMKVYNSKWALVMYSVDGQMITSQNRIVVPMSSNIGDPVDVQYDRDNPNVLIVQSPKRFIIFLLCAGKTRVKIKEDTELRNFPLYCPKCRNETLIDLKQGNITIIKEPDAQTQSR